MKRVAFSIFFAGLLALPVFAQTPAGLTPEQEEKVKRLSGDVETLLAANVELQKKISALSEELSKVREEMARKSGDDSALQSIREDMKKLAEKIQEVDKKRIDDRQVVADKLEEIQKLIKKSLSSTTPATRPPKETTSTNTQERPQKGYEYEVKEGDYLSKILKAVNEQLKSEGKKTVTTKQIIDANNGLDPNKLKVGQKIFIPASDK